MKFNRIRTFGKGAVYKDDIKGRLIENAVTILHNFDLDITGKPKRRWGYKEWDGMVDDFGNPAPFSGAIQGIFQYINVAGEKKVFVVSNGIIYLREYDKIAGGIVWKIVNENEPLVNTSKRIKITSYYDRVYFNDDDQIRFFDTNYNRGIENMYVMFDGAQFYLYNTALSNAEEHDIAVGGGASESVLGEKLYDDIVTAWDAIHGAGDFVANVGFDINWTSIDSDGNYYLLNNGNTSKDGYQIFKVNKDLEFVDFISGTKVTDLRIMQFGLAGFKLYVWDTYDRIKILNAVSLAETSEEVKSWLNFPEISNIKYSHIHADENYVYLYTNKRDINISMGILGTDIKATYSPPATSSYGYMVGIWGGSLSGVSFEGKYYYAYFTDIDYKDSFHLAKIFPTGATRVVQYNSFSDRLFVSDILPIDTGISYFRGTTKLYPFAIGNTVEISDVNITSFGGKRIYSASDYIKGDNVDESYGVQIFNRDSFTIYKVANVQYSPVLGKVADADSFKNFFSFGGGVYFGFKNTDGSAYIYSLDMITKKYKFVDNKSDYVDFVPIGDDYVLSKESGEDYADIWEDIDSEGKINDDNTIDFAPSSSMPFLNYKKNYDLFALQKLDSAHILDYEMSVGASTVKKGFYRYAMEYVFENGERTKLSEWTIPIEVIADDTYVITIKEITTGLYFDKGTGTFNVNSINIYRSFNEDINDSDKVWEAPFVVDSKAFADVDVVTIYADNKQDSDYAPFNYYSEFKVTRDMRFEDIVIHKERLNLIGKKNELNDGTKNSNLIMYSEIGNPEVIEPTAFRPMQSGDKDRIVSGVSVGDYLYIFKEGKTYAILGDSPDGQIIDVSVEYGTSYKFLITDLDGRVYFLNQYGIFFIQGVSPPKKISDPNVDDFFNRQSDLFINFESIDSAFSIKDNIKDEIRFYVPVGKNSILYILLYSARDNTWKTYKYHEDMSDQSNIFEISTDRYLTLLAGKNGIIYEMDEINNDNGQKIRARFKTKAFNAGTTTFNKIYKLIRLTGKYFTTMAINYIIDGDYRFGSVSQRVNNKIHVAEAEVYDGNCKQIEVDVITESANREPIEIDELALGYDPSKRIY